MKNNTKLTIALINKQVKNKNIICVSSQEEYINNKKNLKWQCLLCNLFFEYSKNFIDRSFTGCKNCRNIKAIESAKLVAFQNGGKCLTVQYTRSHDKITCECKNGHIFTISYNNMVNLGHWCPTCSRDNNISENICRAYMEGMFGYSFIKIRPGWLNGIHNRNLELDGYCEILNMAFEHQGAFHYEGKFGADKLADTLVNDAIKLDLCNKLGVKLFIIPQLFHKTPLSKLRQFIIDESFKLGIDVPNKNACIDFANCYQNNKEDIFTMYKNIAVSNGGKCVSEEYYGATNQKLIWQCREGHQWRQFPYVIKKGHWCPQCAGLIGSPNIIR